MQKKVKLLLQNLNGIKLSGTRMHKQIILEG